MTASIEDNYADLCIAALNSIKVYSKKVGKTFDEFFGGKLFDQYTKTVLWYFKANKGVPLTKKMPFRNAHFSISEREDGESGFDIEDKSLGDLSSSLAVSDIINDPDASKIVDAILNDPDVLTSDGRVRYQSLTKSTGLTIHFVNKAMEKLKKVIGNYE